MVKILKVEVEEEEQSFTSYWKGSLMMLGVQLIIAWLYTQCQRRKPKEKNQTEDRPVEEISLEDTTSNSSEEFELIASDSVEEETKPRSQVNYQSIFITRTGYAFHLNKECDHMNHCPLYTTDAADELTRDTLLRRRTLQKKHTQKKP